MKLYGALALLGQVVSTHGQSPLDQVKESLDDETRELFNVATNQLLLDHSNHFQNEDGTFGVIYKIGEDSYTLDDTPENLNYKAYSAVGYGLANSIIIKNDHGFVLIDTGETAEYADELIHEFEKEGILSTDEDGYVLPPLRAMIYTHNHIDHTGGAQGFLARSKLPPCPQKNDGLDETYMASGDCVEIIAHTTIENSVINTSTRTGQVINYRSLYMYGSFIDPLTQTSAVNNGIGPPVIIGASTWHPTTKTFNDSMMLVLESMGVQMQLRYVPSETNDEIIAFLPDCLNGEGGTTCTLDYNTPPQMLGKGLMQAAEAVQGPSFPNLYSLRGTTFRNPLNWYQSVDVLRQYNSWAFLPSHGVPLMGYENIQTLLVNFRDGIAHVHDQALRYFRRGYIPDEVVDMVKLPSYILDNLESLIEGLPQNEEYPINPRDYMRTLYGSVPQSIRQLYCGYIGWNEGDPTNFKPLPRTERANRYIALMGGGKAVLKEAQRAYDKAKYGGDKQEFQWAAELLSDVIYASTTAEDVKVAARTLKARSFLQLAANDATDESELEADWFSLNPNWRNWFITGAGELLITNYNPELGFPYTNVALVAPEIQASLSNPGKWVQMWSWRFNADSEDLNGKTFGWRFMPDPAYWGDKTLMFIQHVDKQVVRYISDPIDVENMWDDVDVAVEIPDQATLYKLVQNDAELKVDTNLPPDQWDFTDIKPTRFSDALLQLIDDNEIKLLKGTAENASNFFLPKYFDTAGAIFPKIVGREGLPGCEVHTNQGQCKKADGCMWEDDECVHAAPSCNAHKNKKLCMKAPGSCDWVDEACVYVSESDYAFSSNIEEADAKEKPASGGVFVTLSAWSFVSALMLWFNYVG